MTKRTKECIMYAITIAGVIYCGLEANSINGIIKDLDEKIYLSEIELQKENLKLEELRNQKSIMDTLGYIEEVAREKLGFVMEDDIVFKRKY